MNDSKYGWVEHLDDGRHRVIFERLLPYSIQTVWDAITDAEQLANWMPGMQFEPRLGGQFHIWFGGDCEGPAHVTGEVSAFAELLQGPRPLRAQLRTASATRTVPFLSIFSSRSTQPVSSRAMARIG